MTSLLVTPVANRQSLCEHCGRSARERRFRRCASEGNRHPLELAPCNKGRVPRVCARERLAAS